VNGTGASSVPSGNVIGTETHPVVSVAVISFWQASQIAMALSFCLPAHDVGRAGSELGRLRAGPGQGRGGRCSVKLVMLPLKGRRTTSETYRVSPSFSYFLC
jgi:hypothetical protein